MKSFITFFTILLFACSSNKQSQFYNSNCNFDDKILESDKILNLELNDKKKLDIEGGIMLKKNDSIEINVSNSYGEYDKRYKYKITNITKLINYNIQNLKVANSYCFYSKGNFNIGNEYFYNDKGEIVQTIDHNQYNKFPICYKEIIKIAQKKISKEFELLNLKRDSAKIEDSKYSYNWEMIFNRKDFKQSKTINAFRIDAKTGEIIKQWISISTPD